MTTSVEAFGKIIFDPKNVTRKHKALSNKYKVAMVFLSGDWCSYYSWFLQKRGLTLNLPLRGAHVSFINDRTYKITGKSTESKLKLWLDVRKTFNHKKIKLSLELTPKSDGKHWWLRVAPDSRGELQAIRDILGIGQPEWGFHMTIGYANSRNKIQSEYLRTLGKKGLLL